MMFQLEGNNTLGREESRAGVLDDCRDFCKLHIMLHYVAVLLGSDSNNTKSFQTVPVGKVGDDATGRDMVRLMTETGMDTRYVITTDSAPTLFSICFLYPDRAGGNITTSRSASSLLHPSEVRAARQLCQKFGKQGIALAAPEVPIKARLELLLMAGSTGMLRFSTLTSAEMTEPSAAECIANTEFLAINRDEATALCGKQYDSDDPLPFLVAVEHKITKLNQNIKLLVTVGELGSWGWENGHWEYIPAARVEVKSTAGAGDASMAGLIVATAAGLPFIRQDAPKRNGLAETPVATAADFAAVLGSVSTISRDTINLDVSPEYVLDHGHSLGLEFCPELKKLLS
jgi:sugar/nucleoside kinase (ribokinase family)